MVNKLSKPKQAPEKRKGIKELFLSKRTVTTNDPENAHLIIIPRHVSELRSSRDGNYELEDFIVNLPKDPRNDSVLELIQEYNGPRAK